MHIAKNYKIATGVASTLRLCRSWRWGALLQWDTTLQWRLSRSEATTVEYSRLHMAWPLGKHISSVVLPVVLN